MEAAIRFVAGVLLNCIFGQHIWNAFLAASG